MAEIAIKIGNSSSACDGQIVDTFDDARIQRAWIEMFCHVKWQQKNQQGCNPIGSLAWHLGRLSRQYRFTPLDSQTLIRINQWTGEATTHGSDEIDIPQYIWRRLQHHRHHIFSGAGRVEWFGGRTDYPAHVIDEMWNRIYAVTGKHRDYYRLWPAGKCDLKEFLFLRVPNEIALAAKEKIVDWKTICRRMRISTASVLDRRRTVDVRHKFCGLNVFAEREVIYG